MSFTEVERAAIRLFAGYPKADAAGNWRTFQARGLLEFRINYLTGTEDAVVRRYLATLVQLQQPPEREADRAEQARMFEGWRRRLCGFLGVPPGPELAASTLREMPA